MEILFLEEASEVILRASVTTVLYKTKTQVRIPTAYLFKYLNSLKHRLNSSITLKILFRSSKFLKRLQLFDVY